MQELLTRFVELSRLLQDNSVANPAPKSFRQRVTRKQIVDSGELAAYISLMETLLVQAKEGGAESTLAPRRSQQLSKQQRWASNVSSAEQRLVEYFETFHPNYILGKLRNNDWMGWQRISESERAEVVSALYAFDDPRVAMTFLDFVIGPQVRRFDIESARSAVMVRIAAPSKSKISPDDAVTMIDWAEQVIKNNDRHSSRRQLPSGCTD